MKPYAYTKVDAALFGNHCIWSLFQLSLGSLSIKFVPNKSQGKRNVIVISRPISPILRDRFYYQFFSEQTLSFLVLVSMILQVATLCEA